MLESSILSLGILPDHNNIDILVARGEPLEVKAVHQRSVEIELLPQHHVQRAHASADRRLEPALEAHLVLLNRLDQLRRHRLHVAVDVVLLEVDRRVHSLHHLLHGAGDERADAVAGDQRDGARGSVAGSGHVGHGSGGSGAGEEVFEDRKSSP